MLGDGLRRVEAGMNEVPGWGEHRSVPGGGRLGSVSRDTAAVDADGNHSQSHQQC